MHSLIQCRNFFTTPVCHAVLPGRPTAASLLQAAHGIIHAEQPYHIVYACTAVCSMMLLALQPYTFCRKTKKLKLFGKRRNRFSKSTQVFFCICQVNSSNFNCMFRLKVRALILSSISGVIPHVLRVITSITTLNSFFN